MEIFNFLKTHFSGILFTFVDDFTLNSDNNKEIWRFYNQMSKPISKWVSATWITVALPKALEGPSIVEIQGDAFLFGGVYYSSGFGILENMSWTSSYYLSNIKAILRGFVGSLNRKKFTRLGINQISQELKVIYLHIYFF